MPAKVEIGYRSQSYGYAESDGSSIYCSGPRRKIIKLLIERIAPPDEDDAAKFLEGLPARLHGRIWARAIEHLPGKHDQSSHANKYGMDKDGNRVLLPKGLGKSFSDELSTIEDFDDRVEFLDKNGGKEWRDSLSDDEKDALNDYAYAGYNAMNDILRNGTKTYTDQDYYEDQIKNATSALMKGQAPCDMSVVRRVGPDQAQHFEGAEGFIYQQKGFSSTTIKPSGVGSFGHGGITMRIDVPKGTPGGYISKDNIGHSNEYEWLLPPNAKFRVNKVSHNNGSKEVHLTYLGV